MALLSTAMKASNRGIGQEGAQMSNHRQDHVEVLVRHRSGNTSSTAGYMNLGFGGEIRPKLYN